MGDTDDIGKSLCNSIFIVPRNEIEILDIMKKLNTNKAGYYIDLMGGYYIDIPWSSDEKHRGDSYLQNRGRDTAHNLSANFYNFKFC